MPRFDPAYYLRAYLLARQGKTDPEIAAELGVDPEDFEDWVCVKKALREALNRGRKEKELDRKIGGKDAQGLTERRKRFVEEYLKDFDAAKAAVRAGYSSKSQKGPEVEGFRLLSDVRVQALLRERMAQQAANTDFTPEDCLRELAWVARADLRAMYDEHGRLKRPEEWPEELARAVAGMDVVVRASTGAGDGDEGELIEVRKIKRWDKLKAIDMLMRYHGMFKDKMELTGPDGGPLLLQALAAVESRTPKPPVDAQRVRELALQQAQANGYPLPAEANGNGNGHGRVNGQEDEHEDESGGGELGPGAE